MIYEAKRISSYRLGGKAVFSDSNSDVFEVSWFMGQKRFVTNGVYEKLAIE